MLAGVLHAAATGTATVSVTIGVIAVSAGISAAGSTGAAAPCSVGRPVCIRAAVRILTVRVLAISRPRFLASSIFAFCSSVS
ncbi:hypothetical protein LJK87_48225 [Paenibacillus sp. P25]|nr:hypothetical protein LJK87_48225 [Paenibacillus sp. P25]